MDSKARRLIKKWIKQDRKDRRPTFIAEGYVFMYPSRGTSDVDHYPVIWLVRKTPKNVINEFLCGCRGWWYSEKDECVHVKDLKKQIEEGRLKLA